MPSLQHRNLLTQIADVDIMQNDTPSYSEWLKARSHLTLLKANANDNEIIVYASSRYTFLYALLFKQDALSALSCRELLDWSGNPFFARVGYSWGGRGDDVWIDETNSLWPSVPGDDIQRLIFARSFHGLRGHDAITYEILQEFLHVSEIFWRSEKSAYCCFDEHGDFNEIISITPKDNNNSLTLVTFQRKQLEQYLAASNSVLVRMFDFTLFRRGEFDGWSDDPEMTLCESDELAYRQKIDEGKASYTRGVQIVGLSRPRSEIFESIKNGWNSGNDNRGVEFIAVDCRNSRVTDISTQASATTNYFDASNNSLPYETSPAFFRPEVLHKYKSDREKYTVSEELRVVSCRGAWDLQTYDINDEGQVHTYLCYLRNLPYDEQVYWRSFNEQPRAGISERAYQSDFEGEWSEVFTPLEKVLHIARRWADIDMAWWTLRDAELLERVNTPCTTSPDEWAGAFKDLAKLIVEGFQVRAIRRRLHESGVSFEEGEKILKLIERFLVARQVLSDGMRLGSLRTVQYVRSNVDAHYGGGDAQKFAVDALVEHGSYTIHFGSVCKGVAHELEMIENAFS